MQKVPGPGKVSNILFQYIEKMDSKSTISYTMRPKTQDVIKNNLSCWKNPGPDTYKSIDLEPKTGRFAVAKYGDSKFAKINPKTERF